MKTEPQHRDSIKQTIKSLVERKVKLTRDRREYKLRTRPLVDRSPEALYERHSFFLNLDSRRANVRSDIRHTLLLYGYLRGRDYKQIEKKCRDDNFPRPSKIVACARDHEVKLIQNDVERWLQGEPSPWRHEPPAAEAAA